MSFYSSIIVFYPGKPPLITLGDFRKFCDTIRFNFATDSKFDKVKLRFAGESGNSSVASWDETESIGVHTETFGKSLTWDFTREHLPWEQLWPDGSIHSRVINRAYVAAGNLRQDLHEELTASSGEGDSYIIPTQLVISIGPVTPMTLDDELSEEECFGELNVSFSGMGYITWQPLAAYWEFVRKGAVLQSVMQVCRNSFPVSSSFDASLLKDRLGDLFLNQNDYEPGNWIASVSESG